MSASLPFLDTLGFGLVWDDPQLLTQISRTAQDGGTNRLLASDFRLVSDWRTGYYRPVTTATLWWQVESAWHEGGADALPKAARALHGVNVLIHASSSLLVWMLLRRITGSDWAALLGAVLFAVHPVHVEAVSFVSARADLLAAMFVLGSVLCWLEARTSTGGIRVAAVTAGSLLAMAGSLAKENALLLPVVLFAWSFLFDRYSREKPLRTLGWLAAWCFAIVVALWLRTQIAHVEIGPESIPGTGSPEAFVRLGLPALMLYLRLWYFPWPLNSYYMEHDLDVGLAAIAGIATTVLLVILAWRAGKGREAVAALCMAFIFLFPVMHLTPLWGAVAAERFLYLPSVGLTLVLSLSLAGLEERGRLLRAASRGIVCGAIMAFIVLTVKGVRPWESNETFFARMLETSPRAPMAHQGMGDVLIRAGKHAHAESEYREAIRLQPDFVSAHLQLGIVCAMQGRPDEAREAFETALRIDPNRAGAHSNLGVLALSQRQYDAAIVHLRRAVELDPDVPRVHYRLGEALLEIGDVESARQEAAILDRLDPDLARRLRDELERRVPD